ncbi:MAG: hypothetical protein EA359_10765 [Balneolaceae bacterium]|nr:MAG: hypothetical protein EA359_10765 [Balneolaceae bacterium]
MNLISERQIISEKSEVSHQGAIFFIGNVARRFIIKIQMGTVFCKPDFDMNLNRSSGNMNLYDKNNEKVLL